MYLRLINLDSIIVCNSDSFIEIIVDAVLNSGSRECNVCSTKVPLQ